MSRLMGEPLQYLIVDHDAALATGYDCISRGHLCGELGTDQFFQIVLFALAIGLGTIDLVKPWA